MKPSQLNRPAWSELFYDLALIGAFLSFGVDFGKSPGWESALVLGLKLVLIFWTWQQTALFVNRFGDPFDRALRGGLPIALLRITFLLQLVAIIALSLVEGDQLVIDQINNELGLAAAVIVLTVAATYEIGGRWRPELKALANGRRNVCIPAALLFLASTLLPSPWGQTVWVLAIFVAMVMTVGPDLDGTLARFPINREHFSERLGLFVLILIGDVFVKTVVTVHEDSVDDPNLLQLGFVAVIAWMIWATYEREVFAFEMPDRSRPLLIWMIAHYIFAPMMLISGIGLVWYVAPDFQKTYGDWIAMVAIGGVGLAIASIGLMRAVGGGADASGAVVRLVATSAGAIVIGLLAWLATPSHWRVGIGTLAIFLLAVNATQEFHRKRTTASDSS